MKRHTLVLIPLVAAAALLPGGCDGPTPGLKPEKYVYPPQVVLEGLDSVLRAEEPIVTVSTPETPMDVVVFVRSVHRAPVNVQYKYEFFDKDGRPLRRNYGWKYMKINPRERKSLQGNALSTEAADYQLTIRPAK